MIYLLGDVHSNFQHVIDVVRKDRPDAIIFLGDLECQRPLQEEIAEIRDLTEIYWIPGNHDTDSTETYRNLFDSELSDRNLHGRVVEIAGIKVAGLGGTFRGEIWYPGNIDVQFASFNDYVAWLATQQPPRLRDAVMSSGKARKHRATIFYEDYINLYGQSADIIVTHEAPSCHPNGFTEIDALAQSLHVKFSFHGHHHDSLNYRQHDKRLGFQAFGVGYCAVTDMFGGRILPGDFDESRKIAHDVASTERADEDLAVEKFRRKELGLNSAATASGLTLEKFMELLGKRGVPVIDLTSEELDYEFRDLKDETK